VQTASKINLRRSWLQCQTVPTNNPSSNFRPGWPPPKHTWEIQPWHKRLREQWPSCLFRGLCYQHPGQHESTHPTHLLSSGSHPAGFSTSLSARHFPASLSVHSTHAHYYVHTPKRRSPGESSMPGTDSLGVGGPALHPRLLGPCATPMFDLHHEAGINKMMRHAFNMPQRHPRGRGTCSPLHLSAVAHPGLRCEHSASAASPFYPCLFPSCLQCNPYLDGVFLSVLARSRSSQSSHP